MTHISTVSKRGLSHPDWNEDNYYLRETEQIILGGIFDGCSTGSHSYFASRLFALTLRNVVEDNSGISDLDDLGYLFCKNLRKNIITLKLKPDEILSTAILFGYNKSTKKLNVTFIGDGAVFAKNSSGTWEELVNDQDNRPNYLAYSLKEITTPEKFKLYWGRQKSYQTTTGDFSISTDGIFSFKIGHAATEAIDAKEYLTRDSFLSQNPSSLRRKINILQNKGYFHDDDVTIIRVVNK